MPWLLLVPLLCVGCSAIFGIETQSTADDTSPTITLVLARTFAYDSAGGTPTTEVVPFTATDGAARVRVDGLPLEVALQPNGTLAFPAALGSRFAAGIADHEIQGIATGDATFVIPFPIFGHPGGTIPMPTTFMDLSDPDAPPTDTYTTVVTGAWEVSDGFVMIPVASMIPIARTEARLPVAGDRIVLLGRSSLTLDYAFDWAGTSTAAIPDGVETLVAITGAPLALDRCAATTVVSGREFSRLAALANSAEFPAVDGALDVFVSPALPLSATLGFSVARLDSVADADVQLAYANPLGHDVALRLAGSISTPASGGFELGHGFSYTMREVADPKAAPCPTYALGAVPVALPEIPALGGVRLDRDSQTVAGSTRLTWGLASEGAVDGYEVTVYDLDQPRIAIAIRTREREVSLDPSLFTHDGTGTYAIKIRAYAGLPNAATGDFATIAYPFGTTFVTSSTFHVQ